MSVCENIERSLGAMFYCTEVHGRTRIRTPFLYPDGEVIDIFYSEPAGIPTFSDLGETMRWLRNQTVAAKRSPKQQKLIADVCLNHSLEFYKGTICTRVRQSESTAAAVIRVAQGALRVADLWFTFRARSVETVTDEVENFLVERHIQFHRAESLVGRSGRTWNIDFHTRTPQRSSLLCALSTGSRGAARNISHGVLAAWHDLSQLRVPQDLQFVSLFDDTMDVWSPEDFRLLDGVSTVARWSRPDELATILAA